jgi:hypothetical protein
VENDIVELKSVVKEQIIELKNLEKMLYQEKKIIFEVIKMIKNDVDLKEIEEKTNSIDLLKDVYNEIIEIKKEDLDIFDYRKNFENKIKNMEQSDIFLHKFQNFKEIKEFANKLLNVNTIRELSLFGKTDFIKINQNHLSDKKLASESISKLILNNENIKAFQISNIKFSSCFEDIIKSISVNKSLTILSLKSCKIDNKLTKCLSKLLDSNQSILKLDLSNNSIDGEMLIDIALNGMSKVMGNIHLKTLILTQNPLNDFGALGIRNILCRNTCIETLNLVQCQISDDGLKNISESIKRNKTLRNLYLENDPKLKDTFDNTYNTKGMDFLVNSLKFNTTLLNLNVIEGLNTKYTNFNKLLMMNYKFFLYAPTNLFEILHEEKKLILKEVEKDYYIKDISIFDVKKTIGIKIFILMKYRKGRTCNGVQISLKQ